MDMLYICHMLTIVFFLLPALVCLVWSVVYLFAKKTDIQHAFGIILLIGVLYFLSYALYINPSAETIWVCRFDAINQPLCLFLLVKIIVYVLSYSDLRHLCNVINQQYGVNFRELINRYRLIAAKEYMLEHPSATQKEIALEVGFRDATAFSHKFKALEGMSPMAWLAGQL